ncbi:DUF1810 domain-containing protein [Endosaccharibacter trunci]
MTECFDLDRFVQAQEPVIDQVRQELAEGRKRTHWMWFVFPQLRGLGHSAMAQLYGLDGRAEAEAFLRHPVLGPRLRDCTDLVLTARPASISDMFGYPDDMKFHSSMTLFAALPGAPECFHTALTTFFDGRQDQNTLRLLRG